MIEKTIAFLDTLTLKELEKLPPARMRKFSELCYHWHRMAEHRLEKKPKSGILADLSQGKRSESE
jgi:hypothetical protein